jgi:phosphatidate cytidylyltransferase
MKRLATAAVLIPVFLYIMLWAPYAAFAAVLALVALLSYWELDGIIAAHEVPRPGIPGAIVGLAFLFAPANLIALTFFVALAALVFAMRSADLRQALPASGAFVLSVFYIFGSWRCAGALRSIAPSLLFFAVALNWVGDTAAMYVGRSFGRHKLAARVSSAKSWEGALASALASVIFGALYFHWAPPHGIPLWWAAVLALAGNIAGQFGDLSESALKRGAGMKDSGTLLPGHGGWLDRVDSVLFSVPVIYTLVLGFQPWRESW